ncbi:MAG: DeoR/GlpR family DNA-binding transcription regulator [Clostridiales bacterium]|nr:DeoR/GlpR family DNA-binding transcription regulator [Clostridiales bacterium]
MINQERKNYILKEISERGAVSVNELTKKLGASESTIRRDLIELSKKGIINKVHGGATVKKNQYLSFEADVRERVMENIDEKKKIASYCATQINDDDFVYLDAGTTTFYMIDFINPQCRATFVTNGIGHALELLRKGFKVYVLGGELKKTTEAVVGLMAARNIHDFNFTKAFIGTNGISETRGFTTPDTEEAFVKAAAVENSFVSYVIADSTKFGKIFSVRFASIDTACIITDKEPEESYKNKTVIKVIN